MPAASEKSIFLAALEKKTPRQREEFLSEACAGDARLRAEVEELLRAHDRPDHVLDAVPSDVGAVQAHYEVANHIEPCLADATADYQPASERPGTVIGPYKLMEQIGEGGFGLVFVAEQQQPVRRKVALKVIKPGMDTRDVIARFEAERQALALMDHPNIAHVFDAGTTDTGRPYFVMELVRGIPITDFCDQNQLTPPERLELFLNLCQAIQHAHQKGIIHRDLKPSNVLVTLHEPGGPGVVKAIDFGIAKAVGQSLTEKTIYTRFAQMMGTPLYMSPEQALMSSIDIDTRSDIYSLAVLLYELLTGTTPFDRKRLETAAFDEIRRIIREEEPPRPSTRLTTLGKQLSTVSAKRHQAPRELSAFVKGDLDWIVMKALEKDRSRRYETVGALAADVRRFLLSEPIEARPPSPLYRFSKLARRNKAVLTTTSLVAVALLLGTTLSVWQAARAVAERDEKEQALNDAVQARNDANEARRNVEQFAERLTEASILISSGRAHADADRWKAAHADYTRATELQPNYYHVWIERGSFYVRVGLWKNAAADYANAMDLEAPAGGPASWGVASLFAYVGDQRRYRQLCTQMVARSADPTNEPSVIEVRSCVLAPEPVSDPAALANRAEQLLAETPERQFGARPREDRPPTERPKRPHDERLDRPRREPPPEPDRHPGSDGDRSPGEPTFRPDQRHHDEADRRPPPRSEGPIGRRPVTGWQPRGANLYVAGLAHYRAGNFDKAIERLRQALTRARLARPAHPVSRPGDGISPRRSRRTRPRGARRRRTVN